MGNNRKSEMLNIKLTQESAFIEPSTTEKMRMFTSSEEDEHIRGAGCYFAMQQLYDDGYFMAEVHDYMSFEKGISCLNIGCNSGAFLVDAAVKYPNSNFTGVDKVPISEIMFAIPNVTFVLGYVLDGLDFPDNSFDYIQMRTYASVFTRDEWPIALREAHRLLKPGGCVGFVEYESRETGNEDCAKVFIALRELMETFNQEPYAGQKLKEWVVDVGLEHIITEETNVDCGPDTGRAKTWRWFWAECCKFIGPLLAPALKVKYADWPDFVDEHIEDMKKFHGHITVIRVLARKPFQ